MAFAHHTLVIDALAYESQFADHLAPLWRALPASVRGRFIVEPALVGYARNIGIEDPQPVPRPDVLRGQQIPPNLGANRPALVASYGDTKEARRLGYGPLAFIEHGAGQSYDSSLRVMASYAGGPDREDTTLILVPNEYSARRWRAAYPSTRVEVVGTPRLDGLPARVPGPGPVVAVSFHFDGPRIPYGGTALHDGYGQVLGELAKRWQLVGHAHPKGDWPTRMERVYRAAGVPFVRDFADVCRQADIYICDNSSTLFEFASTGRPVVLLNASHWQRGHGPGLRFWDAAHVGVNVDRPRDLVAGVERALELRPEDVATREDALDFVYAFRHGAAERGAAALVDWHATHAQVAA